MQIRQSKSLTDVPVDIFRLSAAEKFALHKRKSCTACADNYVPFLTPAEKYAPSPLACRHPWGDEALRRCVA